MLSLNFLVAITRDDMRFVQGKLAKYTNNPGRVHFQVLKRALRFLQGTRGYGVLFSWSAADPPPTDGPLDLRAWSDSSFADDIDTARTTIGNVVQVNNTTVSAYSKLSTRVDSCVNHAELRAFSSVTEDAEVPATAPPGQLTVSATQSLVQVTRTLVWIRGLKAALERRSLASMPPTPVMVDNTGVVSMLQAHTVKQANKHIFRALAECRERVNLDKSAVAVNVDTKDNLANAMTKQEPGVPASAAQLRLITSPAPPMP